VLLHLVFIGLISAATIILFSVAAASLLGIGQEAPTKSRIGHSVLPYTDANAASVPPETSSAWLDSATVLPAFPQQAAPIAETSVVAESEPAYEPPSSDRDASTTTSETADVALIPGLSAIATPSTEVSGSEHATAGRTGRRRSHDTRCLSKRSDRYYSR
jgi:hypothetical protein